MTPEQIAKLRSDLMRDEAKARTRADKPGRYFPYQDIAGKWTIYVGRNLTDNGISEAEGELMLDNDITEHLALLDKYLPWWSTLDEARQLALANLAFNLGVGPSAEQPLGKLLTFHDTLKALQAGEYDVVANHLSVTLWAKQVGERATRIIAAMRNGESTPSGVT
jgi:lysozyme